MATVLGTLQSGLDNFGFLSEDWEKNTKEERLLGVSLTGICDHSFLANNEKGSPSEVLEHLRDLAIDTNATVSFELGLEPSAAITCVKPSGTVSQLCNTASGIHARYGPYYIRRVRMDTKDSLAKWMIKQGVPHVKCDKTTFAFEFPIKAPEGSVFRNDKTAIEQLELWLIYQKHWCEHKPSITVYVEDDEWDTVGAWVKDHLDVLSGVSFLPKQDDSHTYENAPYEDIDEETYERLVAEMPDVDFSKFVEKDDHTTASQEFACTGSQCEIV